MSIRVSFAESATTSMICMPAEYLHLLQHCIQSVLRNAVHIIFIVKVVSLGILRYKCAIASINEVPFHSIDITQAPAQALPGFNDMNELINSELTCGITHLAGGWRISGLWLAGFGCWIRPAGCRNRYSSGSRGSIADIERALIPVMSGGYWHFSTAVRLGLEIFAGCFS